MIWSRWPMASASESAMALRWGLQFKFVMLCRTCSLNLVSQNGNYLQKWKRAQGCVLCMHKSNRSFPCPTFFGNQCTSIQLSQPLIGFILPFAIWCSSSSFLVVFAFSTIMNVCCQFHDETLFITTLHFVKAKIAVDLKRFLYFKLNFWVLQYSYSFGILCEWNITLCCSCS